MESNRTQNNGNGNENSTNNTKGDGAGAGRKEKLPNKLSLMIRIGVALYLFYTVYSLRDVFNNYSGGELIFFVGMMLIFLVIGVVICIFSGRDLMQGRYEGGAMDVEMNEETAAKETGEEETAPELEETKGGEE